MQKLCINITLSSEKSQRHWCQLRTTGVLYRRPQKLETFSKNSRATDIYSQASVSLVHWQPRRQFASLPSLRCTISVSMHISSIILLQRSDVYFFILSTTLSSKKLLLHLNNCLKMARVNFTTFSKLTFFICESYLTCFEQLIFILFTMFLVS